MCFTTLAFLARPQTFVSAMYAYWQPCFARERAGGHAFSLFYSVVSVCSFPELRQRNSIQAATRSCGMTMSAETDGVSRRAALGAFFAGAAAIPGESVCVFVPTFVIFSLRQLKFVDEKRIWANFDSLFSSCRQCRGHALIRQEQGE